MKLENAQLIMNRYLDGVATDEERAHLARAMKADPLLRSEFEELECVHASTESLFRQLQLPESFSNRVMRRLQHEDVPSDETLEAVRLPAQRPLGSRPKPVVTHRKRARVYAIIASISAAAAVMLAIGVLTGFFARAGIGTQGVNPNEKNLAEGRQGGPDREGLNRTGPSTPSPSNATEGSDDTEGVDKDTPESPTPNESSLPEPEDNDQPEPQPEEPLPEIVEQPEPTEPEIPDVLEPEPLPEPTDVVDQPGPPAPVPETPRNTPDETVEEEPKTGPEDSKTEALPTDRVRVGHMLVLNGKAELIDNDGKGKALGEEQELFEGDRIRTSVNGLILLRTDAGDLTLHRKSEVTLKTENEFSLNSGTLALDRNGSQTGSDIAVTAEDYTLYLNHGCAVVERKRRGLVIQKALGFASVSHNEFGTILLDEEAGGYEVDVDFGKPIDESETKTLLMPDWLAESRSRAVMLAVGPALEARGFSNREFKYVEDRLPKQLEKLLRHPAGNDTVTDFILESLDNEVIDGGTLVLMVNEVEIAYFEVTELTPGVISEHARRAAMVAENLDQWKDYFYRLMRPPVEPKNPPQPLPNGNKTSGGSDCPNDDKLKRVEKPKKKIVKVPKETEEPEAEEDKPSS